MIVLDASVLIGYLDRADAHHAAVVELLVDEADEAFRVNALTLAEALVAPARGGKLQLAHDALGAIAVQALDWPPDASRRLAQLRATTGVAMPDCCVLLSAEHEQAAVATFNNTLRAAARGLGLRVLPATP